jgi:hypothetical protein
MTAISRPLGAMPDLGPRPLYLVVVEVACRYEISLEEKLADRLMLYCWNLGYFGSPTPARSIL